MHDFDCETVPRSQLVFFLGVLHVKPKHHEPLSRFLAGEAPTSQSPLPADTITSSVPITPLGVVSEAFRLVRLLAWYCLILRLPRLAIEGIFGATICPPALLARFSPRRAKCGLYHHEPDKFCCWTPLDHNVAASHFRVVFVRNCGNNMDHFGKNEHSYCHWLWLNIDPGVFKL